MPSHRAKQHKIALRTIATIAGAALLLSGCASNPAADPAANQKTENLIFNYGRNAPVTDLDLHTQITANNAFAIDKIFEPLLSFDKDGKIIAWLAASHEITADGRTYTFTLRKNVQFSDASPLQASDVKYSLQRNLDKQGPLLITAPITDIIADDANGTVTIKLAAPHTPLLAELSSFATGIVPKNLGGQNESTFFKNPIGTGPFAIKKWDKTGDLQFTKNRHYWQSGKPKITQLNYIFVADDNQLLQRLNAGQLDAIEQVPAANAAAVKKNHATKLSTGDSWAIEQLFFNTQNPYFADRHSRRAIAMALDRKGITTATTFDTGTAATALIPPAIAYSAAALDYALPHNLAAAKQELAKSATPAGFTAQLLIPSGNSQRAQIAQIVQAALAPLNIKITIESVDIATFRHRFKAYDYDFMLNSGQADAPDPDGLVSFQADPQHFAKSFWTHYQNDRVTELIAAGRTVPAGEKRQAIYYEIQRLIAQDAPYVPLFYAPYLHGTGAKVQNFYALPNGSIRFQDTSVN